MSKSLKYVKDFEFPSHCGFSGSAGKQTVAGYMRGGKVCKAEGGAADVKQDKAMVKAAVHKHEKGMHPGQPMTKLAAGGQAKVGKVMGEYKSGTLHSGSKTGPVVKSPKQAIAIALSEARAAKKKA